MKDTVERERILVVDDDQGLLHLLKMRLMAMGFDVASCTKGEEAIAQARREVFDLAITDLCLPGLDGLTVMEELRLIHPNLPVLDRKSTRLNSSHSQISYAVFCL